MNVCGWPTRFVAVGVIWILASTNVFTASAEFGATPSVWTVNGAEPATESVEVAWPVTLPVAFDVNVIVHCPPRSCSAPAVVQVPVGAVMHGAVRVGQRDVDVLTGGGDEAGPSPMSFSSVTVNVCGAPTRFVADGVIEIRAFTQRLRRRPGVGARTVGVPSQGDARDGERRVRADHRHARHRGREVDRAGAGAAGDVVHGFADVNEPGPLSIVKLICVPSGAFTKPEPSLTFTCAVNVCV